MFRHSFRQLQQNIHCSVQAAHGDLLANAIPLLNERLLGSLCGGERGVKCKQDAHEEGETADHHEKQKNASKREVRTTIDVLCKELKVARVSVQVSPQKEPPES